MRKDASLTSINFDIDAYLADDGWLQDLLFIQRLPRLKQLRQWITDHTSVGHTRVLRVRSFLDRAIAEGVVFGKALRLIRGTRQKRPPIQLI
jgi:hypothetical protein